MDVAYVQILNFRRPSHFGIVVDKGRRNPACLRTDLFRHSPVAADAHFPEWGQVGWEIGQFHVCYLTIIVAGSFLFSTVINIIDTRTQADS